jgi:hypothetical protein
MREYLNACFAAGMPVRTPEGSKLIEQIKPGDLVLSCSEFDPQGAVEARQVEEVFVRTAPLWHLHVGGRVIRTTAEHPFYVQGQGWLPCAELNVRDLLRSDDGQWVAVEDVCDAGEVATVYNFRVAEHHTYFVGSREWGFSVWAHNACKEFVDMMIEAGVDSNPNAVKQAYKRIMQQPVVEREDLFIRLIEKKLGGLSQRQKDNLLEIALMPEPAGKKGGLQANLDGHSGELTTTEHYGVPKNNEKFEVNGRTRIPDHVISRDPVTGEPRIVADTKNAKSVDRLSTQFLDDLALVGPNGRLYIAVPENAYVASTVENHPRIQVDRILPPK